MLDRDSLVFGQLGSPRFLEIKKKGQNKERCLGDGLIARTPFGLNLSERLDCRGPSLPRNCQSTLYLGCFGCTTSLWVHGGSLPSTPSVFCGCGFSTSLVLPFAQFLYFCFSPACNWSNLAGSRLKLVEMAVDTMYIRLFVGRPRYPGTAAGTNVVDGSPPRIVQCLSSSASEGNLPVVAFASACLSAGQGLPNAAMGVDRAAPGEVVDCCFSFLLLPEIIRKSEPSFRRWHSCLLEGQELRHCLQTLDGWKVFLRAGAQHCIP